jgi:hypothetical protein
VHVVTSDGPEILRLARRADHVHIIAMQRRISIWADIQALLGWLRVLLRVRPEFVLAGTPKAGLLGMTASGSPACRVAPTSCKVCDLRAVRAAKE